MKKLTVTDETKLKIKEKIKYFSKRWFIDAFSGMALGLFATLIAGTIFEQIGKLIGDNSVGKLMVAAGGIAKVLMGAGIGAGIAYILKADKLTVFSCIVAGMLGANAKGFLPEFSVAIGIGNPVGAYLAALITAEVCGLYAGKTKLDIILIPLGALFISCLVVITICPPVTWLITKLGEGIAASMLWSPFFMGIIISVAMGLLLTLPTSSAAIWVTIAMTNADSPELLLAGGAAVVGCAAHMVGFAVMSFKENGFSGLISQGLGTSMLQIPNLMKNPKILIPPVVASAIVGPLATCVFKLKCGATGGGMGTAGLVGLFSTVENSADITTTMLVLGIIFLFFVIPAAVSFGVCLLLRKIGWIKKDDLLLPYNRKELVKSEESK